MFISFSHSSWPRFWPVQKKKTSFFFCELLTSPRHLAWNFPQISLSSIITSDSHSLLTLLSVSSFLSLVPLLSLLFISPPHVYTSSLQLRHIPAHHFCAVFAFPSIALNFSSVCVHMRGLYYVLGWIVLQECLGRAATRQRQALDWCNPSKCQTVAHDYFSCTENPITVQNECALHRQRIPRS